MCTYIVEKANISGSGKGAQGWFALRQANVYYDHPYHARLEYALNIDFVNEDEGVGARVAVELTPDSARELVRAILAALETGAGQHGLEESAGVSAGAQG
jgi:hypothetical protein